MTENPPVATRRRLPCPDLQGPLVAVMLAAVAALAAGCSGAGTDAAGSVPMLQLAETPRYTLADESAEAGYLIDRITLPQVFPGPIVGLADRTELLLLDTLGAVVRRAGREGAGPGEFRNVGRWTLCSDQSLLTWDGTLQRITRFPESGPSTERSGAELPGLGGSLTAMACGQQVVLATTGPTTPVSGGPAGLERTSMVIVTVPAELSRVDTVAVADDFLRYQGLTQPLGGFLAVALATGGRLVYGQTSDTLLHVVNGDGETTTVTLRGLPPARPISAELRQARYDYSARTTPASIWNAQLKPIFDAVPWPDVMPRWARLVVEDNGRFWVGEYIPVHEADAPTRWWRVFSADGRIEGQLVLPRSLELFAVAGGLVWVVETLPDDTREIRGYGVR